MLTTGGVVSVSTVGVEESRSCSLRGAAGQEEGTSESEGQGGYKGTVGAGFVHVPGPAEVKLLEIAAEANYPAVHAFAVAALVTEVAKPQAY